MACALSWLRAGPALVSYSDIFYPAAAVATLTSAPGDITIAYDPAWHGLWSARCVDPFSDAESFQMDGRRVIDIGRRPANPDEIQAQYMGLLKFTPAGWAAIETCLASLTPECRDRIE